MPRAIWSGAISFGLVTIPVRLFSAVSTKSVRFNQIDSRTGSRIKRKWVSALDGSEVPSDVLVRGYEITSGNYVTVTDEELESLDPPASRSIDIVEFVDLDEIDPVYYKSAYYLAPDELAAKAYRVLVEALDAADKVGVARMVMRQKEYMVAIRPSDGNLMLSTMVYADEVNAASAIEELDLAESIEITEPERAMAVALIDSLSADFEPEKYEDGYRERVMELIQRKADGEETIIAEAPAAADNTVVDLMAALEASVAAAKEARGRHPSVGAEEADAEDGEDAEVVEAPVKKARKSSAKKKTSAKKKATAKKKSSTRKSAAKKPARKSA